MIRETLASLTAEENLRTLPEIAPEGIYIEHEGKRYLNLSSNDYLGIACRDMHREFMHEIGESDAFLLSNPSFPADYREQSGIYPPRTDPFRSVRRQSRAGTRLRVHGQLRHTAGDNRKRRPDPGRQAGACEPDRRAATLQSGVAAFQPQRHGSSGKAAGPSP